MTEIEWKGVNMFGTVDDSPMTVRQLIETLEEYLKDCEEDEVEDPCVIVYTDSVHYVTGYQYECFPGAAGRPAIWLDVKKEKHEEV